ncbi:unnamed protein product [Musa acuminata subsp. burmannicoides]
MQGGEEDEEEVLRCQINEWYPMFKPHTIRTLFHPLPDPFLRYLLGLNPVSPPPHDDSHSDDDDDAPPPFLLPRPASGRDPLPRPAAGIDPTSLLDCSSQLSVSDEDEAEADSAVVSRARGGGRAVHCRPGRRRLPKLNWSAPRTPPGSLPTGPFGAPPSPTSPSSSSSDSIAHDLSSRPLLLLLLPFHLLPCPPQVVSFLPPRDGVPLLRPPPLPHSHITARSHQLLPGPSRPPPPPHPALIQAFFSEVVGPTFESESYTFDVYVTSDGRVKLIDFNPWRAFTLPLLFTWEELEEEAFNSEEEEVDKVQVEEEARLVEFRIVESQCGVRPGLKTAVPYDYLDTGEGSGWDQFLRRADEELRKQAKTTLHPCDDA